MRPAPESSTGTDDLPAAWPLFVLLAVAAASVCISLHKGYWYSSHDWYHYPIRTTEFVQMLKLGCLYPRWAPDFYHGWGAPFFNFYAPLSFALPALLSLAFRLDVFDAIKLYMLVMSVAGAFGMYALVRHETRRADAAFFAGLMFAFMPYRYVDLYSRGDLAEFAAIEILPYCVWLYRAAWSAPRARLPRVLGAAALAHAMVLLTHTLMGLFGTELFALLLLWPALRAWRQGERARVLAVGVAFGGALALSAIYTVPAFLERSAVHIDWMTTGKAELTANFVHLDWLLKPGFFYLGSAVLVGLPLALLSGLAPATRARVLPTWWWWAPVVGCIAFMLELSTPLWRFVPFARFVQFPWRLLAFVTLFGAVGLGTLWAALIPARGRWPWLLMGVLTLWVATGTDRYYDLRPHPKGTPPQPIDDANATTINNEYLPIAVRSPPLDKPLGTAKVATGRAHIAATQLHGIGYRMQISTDQPTDLDLQRHWFPGWTAHTISGPTVTAVASPEGLIRLQLPAAGSYDVRVDFETTRVRSLALMITLLALLLLYPLLLTISRWRAAAPR